MKKRHKVKSQENWWEGWILAHSYINVKEKRSEIVPKILGFSVYQVTWKEIDNTRIKSCFPEDESEEIVVEQWEELCNVKSEGAS